MDDVATVIVLRDIGGNTGVYVTRDVLAANHEKLQLKYSDLPVWQIAESLNVPNPSFFSQFFKRETGMTPAEYRNG